jgi:hypothetical protein
MKKILVGFMVTLAMASANAWTKKTSIDEMTGEKEAYFTLHSKRSLSLQFPYAGRNQPYLMAYETKGRPVVIYSLEKGQISCHSSCFVEVKFDNEEVAEFEAEGLGDGNSSITFKHSRVFAERAAKAKRILIRTHIYMNGSPVVEFLPKKPLVLFPEGGVR